MRRAALVLPLLLALGVPPAGAAPEPQLTDPRGDTPVASADLVSAVLSVVRESSGEHLQAVVSFAGPLDDRLPYTRGLTFTVAGCRFTATQYTHRSGELGNPGEVGCATGASARTRGTIEAAGSTLTVRVRLDGRDLRRGARVRDLAAFTHPGGVLALHTPLTTAGDVAEGRDWVIAR